MCGRVELSPRVDVLRFSTPLLWLVAFPLLRFSGLLVHLFGPSLAQRSFPRSSLWTLTEGRPLFYIYFFCPTWLQALISPPCGLAFSCRLVDFSLPKFEQKHSGVDDTLFLGEDPGPPTNEVYVFFLVVC